MPKINFVRKGDLDNRMQMVKLIENKSLLKQHEARTFSLTIESFIDMDFSDLFFEWIRMILKI